MTCVKQLTRITLDYIELYKAMAINSLNSADYYPGLCQEKLDLRESCERDYNRVITLFKEIEEKLEHTCK